MSLTYALSDTRQARIIAAKNSSSTSTMAGRKRMEERRVAYRFRSAAPSPRVVSRQFMLLAVFLGLVAGAVLLVFGKMILGGIQEYFTPPKTRPNDGSLVKGRPQAKHQ